MKDEIGRALQSYSSVRPMLAYIYWTAANLVEVDVTIDIFVSCQCSPPSVLPFLELVQRLILHLFLHVYFTSLLGSPCSSQTTYYPQSTDIVLGRGTTKVCGFRKLSIVPQLVGCPRVQWIRMLLFLLVITDILLKKPQCPIVQFVMFMRNYPLWSCHLKEL